MRKALTFILFCVMGFSHSSLTSAPPSVQRFYYDDQTGNLSLDNSGPPLTTLLIESKTMLFTGPKPPDPILSGPFDVYRSDRIFRLSASGFGDIDFGPVIRPGMPIDIVRDDLAFDGSLLGGGRLEEVWLNDQPVRDWVLHYDATTGAISLESPSPSGLVNLNTVVFDSRTGIFTGGKPADLTDPFDVFRPDRMFKIDKSTTGFGSIDLGRVATPGLSDDQLARDLCIGGSYVAGGYLEVARLQTDEGPYLRACDLQPLGGELAPPKLTFTYSAADGHLLLGVSDGLLSNLQLTADFDAFTGTRPLFLSGEFDAFSPRGLFRYSPEGFGDLDFGPAMARGLTFDDLSGNVFVTGSVIPHGSIGEVEFITHGLPEPTSCTLGGVAMAGITMTGRRRIPRRA